MKIIAEFSSLKEFEEFRGSAAPVDTETEVSKDRVASAEAPQKTEEKKEEKNPLKEEKPEAEAQAKPQDAPAVDPTELKALAVKVARAGHRKELKDMLTGYGEKSVTDLIAHKPEVLADFKAGLEALDA
jgi:hypothetical protein